MNNTNEKRELFQKISSKRMRKLLVNRFFYLRMGIISLYVILVSITLTIIISITNNDNNYMQYIALITIFGFAFFIKLVFNIENKDFYDYESYKRQYYILYLLNEIYNNKILNMKKKKQQLWSLSKYYLIELDKTINSFRMLSFFTISREENEIRKLKEDYKNKIMGHLISKEFDESVNQIIIDLLDISFSIYPTKEVIDFTQINNANLDSYNNINRLLNNLSISDGELPFFGLMNVLNKMNKKYIRILVVSVITLLVTAIYMFIDAKKTGDYSIPTVFSLLIGTPIAVELFYNIIDKVHKD